ncbi:MAG TPA: hypothetical protein ENJ75_03165 [Candidatus Kaiserbacteria bacterium]|nr:hypothetical protein [Candidatus Kaiserbacteria bacterium]
MKALLKKIHDFLKYEETKEDSLKDVSVEVLVETYNRLKDQGVITADEPNYTLARKVFLEFNDFNKMNIDEIHAMYRGFVPRSLLPYPKNYIKCAFYIFLDFLKKEKDAKMFEAAQTVGAGLFINTVYPSWDIYQENLELKSMHDDIVFKDGSSFNGHIPREEFKKLYGSYQILKEDYDNSLSSKDVSEEKLIHDFGVLPEIEEDVDMRKS